MSGARGALACLLATAACDPAATAIGTAPAASSTGPRTTSRHRPDAASPRVVAGAPLALAPSRLVDGEVVLIGAAPTGDHAIVDRADGLVRVALDGAPARLGPAQLLADTEAAIYARRSDGAIVAWTSARPGDPARLIQADPTGDLALDDDGGWFATWAGGTLGYGPLDGASYPIAGGRGAAFAPHGGPMLVEIADAASRSRVVSLARGADPSTATTLCTRCRLLAVSPDGRWVATSESVDPDWGPFFVDARLLDGVGSMLRVPVGEQVLGATFDDGSERLTILSDNGAGTLHAAAFALPGNAAPVAACSGDGYVATLLARDHAGCVGRAGCSCIGTLDGDPLLDLRYATLGWDGASVVETAPPTSGCGTSAPFALTLRNARGAIANLPVSDGLAAGALAPTAWTDPDHLLYLDGNTLVLVDASGDPWTTRVVAYGVSEFLWRQPSRRLFYTVRGVDPAVDGLYLAAF